MSDRAKELVKSFETFNNNLIAFVENCSDEDWGKVCPGEGWTVGVVARHIGVGHYNALDLAKMIVAGEKLPDLTGEAIDQANAKHAQEYAGVTREEMLAALRENGSSVSSFLKELSDADLDRTGLMELAGGDISTQQFVDYIIIREGNHHLDNMKAAVRKPA